MINVTLRQLPMQIKELEDTLGGMLLERSARQVALTRFGEDLARRARDILRSVDELGDFARASRDRLAGRLRIGMIPTIAPYLLPKVIGNLTETHRELDKRPAGYSNCCPAGIGDFADRSCLVQ